MVYSKKYLQLQIDFAERAQIVTGKPLEECLLEYTSFYKTFIPDWDFNPNNPLWVDFVNQFKETTDRTEFITKLYHGREPAQLTDKCFGAFSYHYVPEQKVVYLHFKNTGEPEGVLSKERVETRKAELKIMFTEIKEEHPEAEKVSGFSWLYNIEAYKRLFPQEYIENPKEIRGWFKTLALWGQFLDRNQEVKKELVSQFESCITTKEAIEDLEECFPYKILQPRCDITYFYRYLGSN